MSINAAELKTRFTADTTPAEKTLKGFVEKQSSLVSGGFRGVGAAIGLAMTAGLVQSAASWAGEAAKMASYNKQVEDSFADLAGNVGQSSQEMLDALKATSQGGIAEYDLMLAANRAMMLGVADTADEMTRLMEIAMKRGQALGLTDTQAFSDIITGLGRGSALILDNLGIMIDLDQAYAEYAVTLGKTANELTDVEKKQAMVNSAMKDVGGRGGKATVSSWEQIEAATKDFKIALGELIDTPVSFFLTQLSKELRATQTDFENISEWWNDTSSTSTPLEEESDALAKYNTALKEYREALAEAPAGTVGQINQWLEEGRSAVEATNWEMRMYYQLLLNVVEAEEALAKAQQDVAAESLTAAGLGLEETAASMMNYAEVMKAANAEIAKEARQAAVESALAMDEMFNAMARDGAEDLFGDLGDGAWQYMDELRAVAISTYDEWIAKTHDAEIAQYMAQDAVAALVNELGGVEGGVDATTQAMIDNANNIAKIVDNVSGQLFDVIGQDAFDNAYEYERILSEVYTQYIEDGYTAEQATLAARDAADNLVNEITQLHGGTLDDVADAAFRAEQQLWGTAAAAQAVLALVDQSRSSVDSMYLGAVGSGLYSGSEGSALASQVNTEREQLIRDMAEMGVPLDEATYALAEFDAGISATIDAERKQQAELRKTTTATRKAGEAASKASDGLRDLESALGKIPGLFDTTSVTDEDMKLAEAGLYKPKADEYLRQLRDEMLNGKDWEGVDVETAAAALGWDPAKAREHAELFLNEFTAAWNDSSLFADPANIDKFINMDAIQASLEQQQDAAQGEKNLKALFGIGDAEDVNAVAALGLEVQSGLAGWLAENGMDDAGARLAEALAGGLATDDIGQAAAAGMNDFVGSADGQKAFYDVGYDAGGSVGQGITDRILDDLKSSAPPATGGQLPPALPPRLPGDGASAYGGVSAQGTVVVNQQFVNRNPVEGDINARKAAEYIRRKQRR